MTRPENKRYAKRVRLSLKRAEALEKAWQSFEAVKDKWKAVVSDKRCPYCQNFIIPHWRYCDRKECIKANQKARDAKRLKKLTNQLEQ